MDWKKFNGLLAQSTWLVPQNLTTTLISDFKFLQEKSWDLKQEKVKQAALRVFYTLGMVLAGATIAIATAGLIWSSAKVIVQITIAASCYLACRLLFEATFRS